jgi:hypothetical protein
VYVPITEVTNVVVVLKLVVVLWSTVRKVVVRYSAVALEVPVALEVAYTVPNVVVVLKLVVVL